MSPLPHDPTDRAEWPAIGGVLLAALAVGFAPIFAKLAMAAGVGPIAAAGWRLVFAAAAMGPVVIVLRRRPAEPAVLDQRPPPAWALALVPGLLFAGDLASWHLAFERTTAANATVLANTSVLLVSAVGYLLGERFNWRLPFGAVIGLAGVAGLVGVSFGVGGRQQVIGDLLSLVTAAFYASYILSVKWLRRGYDAPTILLASSVTGAVACFALAALWGEALVPQRSVGWAHLVALGLVCHVGGQGLIALCLRRLPASLASVLILTQTVHVAWLGALLLDERLTLSQLASMALVLVGVGLAITGRRAVAGREAGEGG